MQCDVMECHVVWCDVMRCDAWLHLKCPPRFSRCYIVFLGFVNLILAGDGRLFVMAKTKQKSYVMYCVCMYACMYVCLFDGKQHLVLAKVFDVSGPTATPRECLRGMFARMSVVEVSVYPSLWVRYALETSQKPIYCEQHRSQAFIANFKNVDIAIQKVGSSIIVFLQNS